MKTNSPEHYSSIATLPRARMDSLPLRNCLVILFRTLCQLIDEPSVQNGKEVPLQQRNKTLSTREAVEHSYNDHARMLPEITVGSKVALQNHETKRWDIYGTVTDIGPHRIRYFVKTQSRRVLVRNRRF